MIDLLFEICVIILELVAGLLGISYQTINVVFFCMIWPAVTIWLIWRVRQLNSAVEDYRQKWLGELAKRK